MPDLNILRLSPDDSRLKKFRNRLLSEDLGVDPQLVNAMTTRQQILSTFTKNSDVEEIYKFSDLKWYQVGFDEVLALEQDGEIVSISGIKRYSNDIIRLGMHYYTLKAFRKMVRSILWKKNGFIDHSMRFRQPAKCFFISIFAHNKKLKSWVVRLKQGKRYGQMAIENKDITSCLRLFTPAGEVIFNGVPQLILYCSPEKQGLPKDFLSSIGATT